ncbi:MAG TPA: hypothetical protein VFO19_12105 [Vicinamibacterales bacterium]|nr:hypothetical protein [Vicinamibacterales bacterium]
MGRHQPALLGGLFIGVISALPVVGSLNICCCLWVVLGGGLTVYLQQQRTPEPLETGEAVLGGLIAGLLGAVIYVLLQSLLMSIMPIPQDAIRDALERNPDVPAELRDMILRFTSGQGVLALMLAINIPAMAVFSMLGALLGLAIFRKKVPPAYTPPSPPAPGV